MASDPHPDDDQPGGVERRARAEAGHADRMRDIEYEIVGEIGPVAGLDDLFDNEPPDLITDE